MSPLDMLIFLFFILVTIKAASSCIEYWREPSEPSVRPASPKIRTSASLSRTVRTGRPSSVRITPIKRVNAPVTASSRIRTSAHQSQLKNKSAA